MYTGNGTNETTNYVGGLMEVVVAGPYRHYIYAGSEAVAVYARSSAGNTFTYVLSDHEGSTSDLTSSSGTSVVNESFTPFGQRRNPTTWSGAASNSDLTTAAGITRQGYTFQTQLGLWMGMNHMNGRVEDAVTGRMLSVDPRVPDETNPQSYNRYSYVNNNPLSFIDPSGFDGCQDNTCKQDGGGGTTDFTGGVSAAMYASMLSSGSYASLVGAGVAFNEDHDLSGLGVIGSITQTVTTNGTASDSETGAEASSTGTVNTAPSTGANGTPQDNTTTPSTSAPTGTAPGTDAPPQQQVVVSSTPETSSPQVPTQVAQIGPEVIPGLEEIVVEGTRLGKPLETPKYTETQPPPERPMLPYPQNGPVNPYLNQTGRFTKWFLWWSLIVRGLLNIQSSAPPVTPTPPSAPAAAPAPVCPKGYICA